MPEAQEAEEKQEEERSGSPLDDHDYLVELYHEQDLTQAQIAEEHDVTSSTVSHYMNKHGIETRAHVVDDDRLEDADWLREQYIEQERTMQEIADEVGCSDGTVMRRIHKHLSEDELAERSGTRSGGDEDDGEDEAEADDGDESDEE